MSKKGIFAHGKVYLVRLVSKKGIFAHGIGGWSGSRMVEWISPRHYLLLEKVDQMNFTGRCSLQMPLGNGVLPDSDVSAENNPYLARGCGLQMHLGDVTLPDSAVSTENNPYPSRTYGLQMCLGEVTLPDSATFTENNPYLARVCGLQMVLKKMQMQTFKANLV